MRILIFILSLLPIAVFAQAPYSGGAGDGFDMAEVSGINPTVGVEAHNLDKFELYPNPAKAGSKLTITVREKTEVTLRTISKELAQYSLQAGSTKIQLPELSAGVYYLLAGRQIRMFAIID
ncbi:MAG: hypothetical protein ACI959_000099 [Limisphaerales bacterium]|jgi:hypothetical protein